MADRIEDIVLSHSGRGMTKLRHYLPEGYISKAAAAVLALPRRTIFLTTGFYIPADDAARSGDTAEGADAAKTDGAAEAGNAAKATGAAEEGSAAKAAGAAETDGPPGIFSLAKALKQLHFRPVIVTDGICRGLFEPFGFDVVYLSGDEGRKSYRELLDRYKPVAFLSVERCGRNADKEYTNMRGVSITKSTAPVDRLFDMARADDVLTIGIGDGGNEIGMGNVAWALLREHIFDHPCIVTSDRLIIATTSNWGAFALTAWLSILSSRNLLLSYKEYADFLSSIVQKGCVDGISHKPQLTVDGFSSLVEKDILDRLNGAVEYMLGA